VVGVELCDVVAVDVIVEVGVEVGVEVIVVVGVVRSHPTKVPSMSRASVSVFSAAAAAVHSPRGVPRKLPTHRICTCGVPGEN
jgi:hypothetical protein